MKKIILIVILLALLNGVSFAAVSPAIITSGAAASSAANNARRQESAKEASKFVEADSFVKCDQENGKCKEYIKNTGCSMSYNLVTARDFLKNKIPNSVYKGFSYDSYSNDIYIYYTEKQGK